MLVGPVAFLDLPAVTEPNRPAIMPWAIVDESPSREALHSNPILLRNASHQVSLRSPTPAELVEEFQAKLFMDESAGSRIG
jgi:hypothetical protein